MRKMALGALLIAGAAIGGAGVSARDLPDTGREIRVFVLDKTGTAVDVKSWMGAIDLTPGNGSRSSFKLEQATPGPVGDLKDRVDRYAKKAPEPQAAEPRRPMLCGQVRKLDDWWVEMVFVRAQLSKKSEEGRDEGKYASKGFVHDHDGAYFKVFVDESAVRDSKTGSINFKAALTFTLPNGDTKTVKGFNYPEGMVDDVLGRTIDKEFKDTSKLDHDQAVGLVHRVKATLHALPPLSFKDDGDRKEYDKAVQECTEACMNLENASGKDIEGCADKCKSTLKQVRSQGKDAQGALTAD